MNKLARYTMFGMLYFVQGTILSYFTALNPIYLRSFRLSMTEIGIIGTIGMIPFVIKIFFGMLSDRFNLLRLGHRKPYILIGLLIQISGLIAIPSIDPSASFGLFALCAFLIMTGMALYDTCTDGLALDTTPANEQGTIQGIMVGGRALGVVIISAILGLLVKQISWQAMFWTMAGLTALPIPLVLASKEAQRPAEKRFEWKAFAAFSRKPIIALAGLGALYSLVTNGANEIFTPFLHEGFGVDEFGAGLYISVWGIGIIIGGLTGGRLVDRYGQRRAVISATFITAGAIAALALIGSPLAAWPLAALFGLAYGYYETIYFATAMNVSDGRIAASMFSILMAIANIGTAAGLAISGILVDSINYQTTFLIIAGLSFLALPLLPIIFGRSSSVQK